MVILPNFLYGLWEWFYVKELNDIWFYEPLVSKGNNFEEFNHFRNGQIRANGFFVGTLAYAATAFCSTIIFLMIKNDRISYFKVIIPLIMLYLSHTRTFFIGLIFFLVIAFVSNKILRKKISVTSITFILGINFLSVLILMPFLTKDYSAIGRIYQWHNALSLMFSYPFGQGFSSIGANGDGRADSQIIDLMKIYGIFFFPLFLSFVFIITSYWTKIRNLNVSRYMELPFILIVSYIFILFFQSLVDATVIYFILYLLFKSVLSVKANEGKL